MRAITVFCSSSTILEPHFARAARRVGEELARRGLVLVYGGGSIGLMGETARAAKAAGGRVEGIITQQLLDLEQGWTGCDELVVVDSMRERKRLLEARGDAFVVLPGGLGTYEEFFEILVSRYLGNHPKPIGVVNDDGYYDPLVALIEHGIDHKFIRPSVRELLAIHADPIELLNILLDRAATRTR
ncbi:MAG: TIGR00730 family Rossman fold protein [Phycisphaerales bacterium]